jgi:hypothetical protein
MEQVVKLVVRSPEKAGVGGSTPSLATTTSRVSVTSLPFLIIHLIAQSQGEELLTLAPINSKQAG